VIVHESFKGALGKSVGASELASWKNSLRHMDTVLEDAGIIRSVAALVLLGVVYQFSNGVSSGKTTGSDSAANPLAALLGAVLILAVILVVLAVVCGAAFLIWKVISARPPWDNPHFGAVSEPVQDEESEVGSVTVAERLDDLDWFQLEKLVVALFEASGYRAEHRGGANPDGGIDLVVENADGRVAVQCKHWGKWKCGVAVVRELMGSMLHDGIPQGYLIATEMTPDARELAAEHSIGTMDREELSRWIEGALAAKNHNVRRALERPEKLCPKCGSKMVQRIAKKGRNSGGIFWGCSRYPQCNQIMNI